MALERLSVILELVTGNYKKEAREAATATGQIGNAATRTESSANRMAAGVGRVGSVIKTALAGAAVGAIAEVVGDLDQLGQKMESTERMATTVFGDMIDEARAWANANNEAFGIGESAMLSLISKTQDLLVPMGFVREEAFGMSKEILNVANALSEWEGGTITAEDAQLRLAKAMLGEREGLVELGVKITDQEVKARLAAKGQDKLTGAIRQQAIAQATLELVTEKSTDALTAYEGRAGTATAAQKELAASTADTAESWAELLRGPLDTAKGTLSDVTNIMQFLSEVMAENAGQAGDTAEETDGLVQVWGASQPVAAALIDIIGWLGDKTKEAGSDAATARPKFQGLTSELYKAKAGAAAAGGATDELADSLRALTDPTFAVLNAMNRAAEAQRNYVAAVLEHGPASEEAEQAALDLGEAQARANSAAMTFATEGGPASVEAVIAILINAGVAADTIDRIREAILELNATPITGRSFPLVTTGPSGVGVHHRQHGGSVHAGQPYIVGEAGPEWYVPDQSGMILPFGMGLGGNVTYMTKQGSTIVVQSPMNNFRQDLQYATILASVTNLVEGF